MATFTKEIKMEVIGSLLAMLDFIGLMQLEQILIK